MIYDVHAHCVPEGLVTDLRRQSKRFQSSFEETPRGVKVNMAGFTTLPINEGLISLDRRLETMDRQGVNVQVLSAFIDLVGYELEADLGAEWSRSYNESLVLEATRRPDRFRSLATVPIQDGESAAVELEYAVSKLGMLGAQVGTHIGERQLDDPDLEQLWAKASALGCLILLHPRDPLGRLPIDDYMIRQLIGRPAETTLAVGRMMLSGVLDRHPGMNLIVVHGGGFLPYQVGRIRQGLAFPKSVTGIGAISDPTDHMKAMYYDTVLNDPGALRALVEMVGPGRVLVGSDYPFALGDLDPLRSLAEAGIEGEVFEMITRVNYETMVANVGSRDE
jgi:aminocarboxymuconate-semialdehyde decarboxylase